MGSMCETTQGTGLHFNTWESYQFTSITWFICFHLFSHVVTVHVNFHSTISTDRSGLHFNSWIPIYLPSSHDSYAFIYFHMQFQLSFNNLNRLLIKKKKTKQIDHQVNFPLLVMSKNINHKGVKFINDSINGKGKHDLIP